MKYVLNSAVITSPGTYKYQIVSPGFARVFCDDEIVQSTIGYPATAEALTVLTGIPVAVNRVQIRMEPEDTALVFRLTCRLDDPTLKGTLSPEFVRENCEIGLLTRID